MVRFGVIANNGDDPYNDTIQHVKSTNGGATFGSREVEICPTYGGGNDVQSSYPLCQSDWNPGTPSSSQLCHQDTTTWQWSIFPTAPVSWDLDYVNDAAVVKVNGTYYQYFDAPRTGRCGSGVNGQVFLARSSDGRTWTKYLNAGQAPTPILRNPDDLYCVGTCTLPAYPGLTNRYGLGEPSVVYKDGKFWMYYISIPWNAYSYVVRAESLDGISFTNRQRIFGADRIPCDTDAGCTGFDVKYIPGWNLWLMTHQVRYNTGVSKLWWNISRDGLHWLPIRWTPWNTNGERTLSTGSSTFALNPA